MTSYTEVFEEQCPIYMSYGMSWHDYWYGDPRALRYYREAEKKRQEALNEQAWLQGIYIYKAVSTALTNAFAKKGTPAEPYMLAPIDLSEPTRADELIEIGKSRARKVRSLNRLIAMEEGQDNGS